MFRTIGSEENNALDDRRTNPPSPCGSETALEYCADFTRTAFTKPQSQFTNVSPKKPPNDVFITAPCIGNHRLAINFVALISDRNIRVSVLHFCGCYPGRLGLAGFSSVLKKSYSKEAVYFNLQYCYFILWTSAVLQVRGTGLKFLDESGEGEGWILSTASISRSAKMKDLGRATNYSFFDVWF